MELLKRGGGTQEQRVLEIASQAKKKKKRKGPKIRCPKCNWEPDGQPYWMCSNMLRGPRGEPIPCGCVWNTFATRGKCPDCHFQWKDTKCPRCHKWSKHRDWYDDGTWDDETD